MITQQASYQPVNHDHTSLCVLWKYSQRESEEHASSIHTLPLPVCSKLASLLSSLHKKLSLTHFLSSHDHLSPLTASELILVVCRARWSAVVCALPWSQCSPERRAVVGRGDSWGLTVGQCRGFRFSPAGDGGVEGGRCATCRKCPQERMPLGMGIVICFILWFCVKQDYDEMIVTLQLKTLKEKCFSNALKVL